MPQLDSTPDVGFPSNLMPTSNSDQEQVNGQAEAHILMSQRKGTRFLNETNAPDVSVG
jgi:hypothetical protein